MNGQLITHALLATLAYLPLAFVLAACWGELVSFLKKSSDHQPGITALLFGAVVLSSICVVASLALPSTDSAATIANWPSFAPKWGNFTGIASLILVTGTYIFRLFIKKHEPNLCPKKLRDFRVGQSFCLAGSALILLAGALTFQAAGTLGHLLAFLPISLLAAVIFLELLSAARSSESYHASIVAILFVTVAASGLAIAASAASIATIDSTPLWLSPWGVAAAAFIGFAYFVKLSARKKIIHGKDPAIIAVQTPIQRLQALTAKPSPTAYSLTILLALPLIALVHLRIGTDRESIVAKISEIFNETKSLSPAKAPQESPSTAYKTGSGSVSSIATVATTTTPPVPPSPFGEESGEDTTPEDSLAMSDLPENDPPVEQPVVKPPEEDAEDTIPEVVMTGLSDTKASKKNNRSALNVAAIKPYDDGSYFVSKVQPILKSYCYKCHSISKKRGGLQLHNASAIRAGGDGGSVLIAGNPERSSIYTSTTLGENDPDVMPNKGDLLSQKQQAILQKWILDGAHMDDGEISSALATSGNSGNFLIDKQAARIAPPNASVIQALAQSGVQFRALSGNGALIKVDYSHGDRGRPQLSDLETIKGNIYHLDLSRTSTTDEDLAIVATFPLLHKLELSHTSIGDDGIAHLAKLKYLKTLNLYNTNVGSDGLEALHSLKSLEKIYAFNSRVSKAGAESAEASIKGLKVVIE